MSRLRLMALFLLIVLGSINTSNAREHFDAFESWYTNKSQYASVTYPEGYERLAQRSLDIADRVIPQLNEFLSWTPESPVQIVLSNQVDQANGYATPIPYNRSVLYAALPSGVSELQDYDEWFDLLILHELTHIVHLDKARDWSYAPRYVFGRNLFTFSNLFQPNFFKEGLATYVETSWESASGRGQSAFYNMMMRAEVASGLLPLGKTQQSTRDWPLNKAYSYGVPFYQFLDEVYGINAIQSYVDTTSGQLIPFVVDRPARHNTNSGGLEALWSAYLQWLQARYQGQISSLSGSTTQYQKISETGYFNTSPAVDSSGNVYYVAFDPYGPTFITVVDRQGNKKPLVRAQSNAKIIRVDDQTLWYLQQSPCTHNSYSTDLYQLDLETKQSKKITECSHYTDGTIQNDRLIAVKSIKARRSIVSRDLKSDTETMLFEANDFDNIGSIDALDDKTLVFTYKGAASKWSIRTLDLNSGSSSTLLSSKTDNYFAFAIGKRLSSHTQSLIVTSDKNGLIELWELNLSTKQLLPLTLSIGGAIEGHYDQKNNELVYRSYSDKGWDIARANYEVLDYAEQRADSTYRLRKPGKGFELSSGLLPSSQTQTKDYSALETVSPTSWFFGYTSDNAQDTLSIILSGRDALNFHNWALVAGRDFENEVNLLQASYTLYNHFTALYSKDYDYTLGGATAPPVYFDKPIVLQTNQNIALLAHTDLPFDFSSLRLVAGANQEDREREYILNPLFNNTLTVNTVGVSLNYADSNMALYGISPSHGRSLALNIERDQLEIDVPAIGEASSYGNVWTFEWNEYIQLYQAHTLVLRLLNGYAEKGADIFDLGDSPGFSAFEQAVIHRREYPLRGYPDSANELIGYKPEIYSADYRFPIAYVDKGLSSWPLGLHTISGSIFYEAGSPERGGRMFDAAGIELNVGIDIGYSLLPVATRFGIAVPLDETSAAPDKDPNFYFGFGYSL